MSQFRWDHKQNFVGDEKLLQSKKETSLFFFMLKNFHPHVEFYLNSGMKDDKEDVEEKGRWHSG